MVEIEKVLSRLFIDAGGFESEDYLHAYGQPQQALLMFKLFFPDLVMVDRHPVFGWRCDTSDVDKLKELIASSPSDVQQILEGYRWFEVPYLISDRSLSDDDDRVLAECLRYSIDAMLVSEFPGRIWVVRLMEPEETGSVIGVMFTEIDIRKDPLL